MLELLSQHFLATVLTIVIVILGFLQLWQYHRRTIKRLKSSYDKVLNHMQDGFVVHKADGSIIGFNAAAYTILGLTEDELLRRTSVDPRWQAFREDGTPFPGNEHPSMVTLTTGQIQQDVIMGVCCPNGDKRWLSINTVPLFEWDAVNPSHVVATFRDITRSRALEDEAKDARQQLTLLQERQEHLQESKAKAEETSRTKSDFLANMSREFRTPLNGIFGMIALLKDSELSPAQLTMLNTVESCSRNILTVLNEVLDFGNLDGRRMQLEVAPFNLHECTSEVIKLFTPQANQKRLPLFFDYDASAPRAVQGDAARVRQILCNLLGNAIKFSDAGDIRLSISGHSLEGSRFHFVIAVQDCGIGINPVEQQRLIQAFSQADSSISRQVGGTGLGLAISSSLAHIMGGRLEVDSEPGHGSTFRLQLPLDLTAAAASSPPPFPGDFEAGFLDADKRILVVEDNKINQIVVTSLLAKLGYTQVDVVDDGLMALQQLELKSYDIVFMDMQMPGMDGITATRRIRERMNNQPLIIVAMTASAFEEDRRKCLEAGMNEFLAKPFNRKDLERILRQLRQERNAS